MNKAILQVCAYAAPYPGNFIASLIALAESNKELGYETIFIFPETASNIDWCNNLKNDYKVYYLPLSQARLKPQTYKIMKKIYSSHDVKIAHSHFELYDMPVTVTAPKNTKVFWHLHDDLDLIYNKSNIVYKFLWKCQYAVTSKKAKLLSVSEKGKRFAVKLGFNNDNAYFIPNAIDTARLDDCNEKLDNNYDFVIYGWDYKRKGVDILVDAVAKTKISDYTCGVVSSAEVWNIIKGTPHFINQEPVKNVSALYDATKCFLHISRQEGLSYALLEAIYSGCAVICSDIEQNMFAEEFPSVKIIKVENSTELAHTMDQFLTGELNITEEMVEVSRKIIMDKYSIDSWVKNIQKHYFS